MKTLSAILKAGRIKSGLSAIEAAEAFGVGKDVIYAWEGGGAVPKLGVVMRVCDAYGLAGAELLRAASSEWRMPTRLINRPCAPASVFHLTGQP